MDVCETVDHNVGYVRQQSEMTCWAASLAMIVNYRDGTSWDDHTLCEHLGMPEDGATVAQVDQALAALNLQLIPPACELPEGWIDLLRGGPKGVIVPGAPWHRIVIAGVQTDGTPETTHLHVLDPELGESWMDYRTVESRFEAGYPRSNNVFGYY
ncbi:MAG TPA: papain-like cysteine protease family protein [Jatrophihabitans sp.]|jgi:ABC-type bacteriocin/lantibiotic exporter with double-glycine peptidase domain|nr:papain-like cysteine protease family protein [Jatrophihabitans sp.]